MSQTLALPTPSAAVPWRRNKNHNRFLTLQQQAVVGVTIDLLYVLVLEPVILIALGIRSPSTIFGLWFLTFLPSLIGLNVTTVHLHRANTHGSVTLHPVVVMLCRIAIFISSGMKPREWRGVHKQHHAHPDQEGDPHSPVVDGFWSVFFGTGYLYHFALKHPTDELNSYIAERPPDRWDKLFFDKGWLGYLVCLPIIYGLLLYGLFGNVWLHHLEILPIMLVIDIVFFLLAGGFVNGVGHTAKQPDPNPKVGYSRNIKLGFLFLRLAWGEESHNNHHRYQSSAKFNKNDIKDPGWLEICLLRTLRLATVNYVAPELK